MSDKPLPKLTWSAEPHWLVRHSEQTADCSRCTRDHSTLAGEEKEKRSKCEEGIRR